jgi:hypothetical protein
MKYQVSLKYGAWVSVEVEADSPEEAVDLAFESEEAEHSLCHQCANDIEVGHPSSCVVSTQDGEEVYLMIPMKGSCRNK